ncbi:MAG: hypothetical protein G8D88_13855 [gamma proteobacterium symbiont of Ctena orbiculata]
MKTKKQTRTVSTRLNPAQYIQLQELSENLDLSHSDILKAGLDQLAEKRGNDAMEYRLMSFFFDLTLNTLEFDDAEQSKLRELLNQHVKRIGGAA